MSDVVGYVCVRVSWAIISKCACLLVLVRSVFPLAKRNDIAFINVCLIF